jgi:hypothetical protein
LHAQDWSAQLGRLLQEYKRKGTDPPKSWVATHKAKPKGEIHPGDIRVDLFTLKTFPTPVVLAEPEDVNTELLTGMDEDAQFKLSQRILNWRQRQAQLDWTTGENIRRYIGLLLDSAIILDPVTGEKILKYNPSDMKSMTSALLDVQKIQRLALGLSSENIGFPLKGTDAGGSQLPIIEVNITDKPLPDENADVVKPPCS